MISEPTWLVRIIECFDKETDELVSDQILPKIDLELLQKQWNQLKTEPMIGVFDINEKQAKYLVSLVSTLKFDFDKYDYQISAITTDSEKSKADGGFMGEYPPPKTLPAFIELTRVKSK